MGEVATAVLLLFGAGLLLRTLIAVDSFDRGYRAESVAVDAGRSAGLEVSDAGVAAAVLRPGRSAKSAPSRACADVAWTSSLPLDASTTATLSFEIVGDPPLRRRAAADHRLPGRQPDLFLDARPADRRRTRVRPPRHARQRRRLHRQRGVRPRRSDGRSPIGLRVALRAALAPQASRTCARSSASRGRSRAGRTSRRTSCRSTCRSRRTCRTTSSWSCGRRRGSAEALAPSVRAAISRIDKEQLVSIRDIMTLEDIDWAATGRHRFRAVMVGAFAALALVLAMVGVFGILAYSVQQRIRDFGVRRALGASTGDVLRLVVSSAAARRRRRRGDRPRPRGALRPPDRDDAVRRRSRWTSRRSRW